MQRVSKSIKNGEGVENDEKPETSAKSARKKSGNGENMQEKSINVQHMNPA